MQRDEAGISAIEYSLLASLIAVAIIASLFAVRGDLSALWNRVASAVTGS